MGNWNISRPSATTTVELTSGQDVHEDHTLTTMASRQDELLHKLSEMGKSLGELSEIKKSITALSTQQTQVVDLTKSMMEELRLLHCSRPETTAFDNSPNHDAIIIYPNLTMDREPASMAAN